MSNRSSYHPRSYHAPQPPPITLPTLPPDNNRVLPPLHTVVDLHTPFPRMIKQQYLPSVSPQRAAPTPFQHNLPPSFNFNSSKSEQPRVDIPSEITDRGTDLLTPRSNFPNRILPPVAIMPYGAGGIWENGAFPGAAHSTLKEVAEHSWDWGIDLKNLPDFQPGQQVLFRQLPRDGRSVWSSWQQAMVIRKFIQRALLGTELLYYDIQVRGSSGKARVTPLVGEIWDGISPPPTHTPNDARFFYAKIRSVYVPFTLVTPTDGRRKTAWLPAMISSQASDPDITVRLLPPAPTQIETKVTRVLPYTARTTDLLRKMGYTVVVKST